MQATLRKDAAAELRRLKGAGGYRRTTDDRRQTSAYRRTTDVRIRLDRLEWAAGALGALAKLSQPGAVASPGALTTLLVVRSLGHAPLLTGAAAYRLASSGACAGERASLAAPALRPWPLGAPGMD
jgi:hypothetical protein